MTLLIIGLSLSFIAIGVLYYLNNQLKKRLERNNRALLVFQQEFSQYQVDQGKHDRDETTKREIRFDNVARSIKKNEDDIYNVNQTLPEKIRKVIGHIEFARPLDKK